MHPKDANAHSSATVELDPKLTRQFDDSISAWIWARVEPLGKFLTVLLLAFICWASAKTYGFVSGMKTQGDQTAAKQTQIVARLDEMTATLATMKDIPAKVAALEHRSDSMEENQRKSDSNQSQIMQQLSNLQGFISGINANKKDPTK